ncbi:hypothetical protein L6452_15679 [Arctium lappa]|uniref:Uncharacterized protein n=1 Tax=Arctium lappa TaxID=4217 RepID=A0ACB9CPJ8_ARCLA|nr:hypothetical protein L6452_15679 [Arctium lappa]
MQCEFVTFNVQENVIAGEEEGGGGGRIGSQRRSFVLLGNGAGDAEDAEGATEEAEKSNHVVRKLEKRQEERKLDPHVEEKLSGGHVLAAISSRLGHCGRADGELKQLQNMNSNQVGLVCIADCKDLEQLQKMNSSDELWGHNHAECVRVRELYYPDIDTMIENMDDFMMEMAMETDEEEKKEEDRNKLVMELLAYLKGKTSFLLPSNL